MARQVELVVETGAGVPQANSFVSETQIVAYALARGIVLPFTTEPEKDAVAVLGIKSADYLRALPWRGEPVSPGQTMPFPRKNINMVTPFPENAVPLAVTEAQLQLTLLVNGGTDLLPTTAGTGFLIKEKIGPIENMYSEKVGLSKTGRPILPGVDGLLEPWLLADLSETVPVMIISLGSRDRGC